MKKKNSKNYIAFTLTEMTMVLLIMSVIAAVSAPLVKHAVSDVVSTSTSESTTMGSPWRKLDSLQGIFYSSVGNGMVSIGNIPSADAVNYDYPALLVQSNYTNNASDTAQIGFYSGNADTTPKLSLDRYNNILAGLGTSKNLSGFDSIEIGKYVGMANANGSHISIGSNITRYNDDDTKTTYMEDSIAIGDNITSYGNSNGAVVIGSNNSSFAYSIFIGQNIKPSYSYKDVYIGNMAGLMSYASNYIAIGYYAGFANRYTDLSESVQNVNIGTYAGAVINSDVLTYNDVNIGTYAGLKIDKGDRFENVAIGYGALAPVDFNLSPVDANYTKSENVAIGTSAGATNRSVERSIMIGYYAGLNSDFNTVNSIAIGPFANANSLDNQQNNIAIGYYAGYNEYRAEDNIFIGSYAGYDGSINKSLSIGHYAGYKASITNTVGIGMYACAFARTRRAFCFGDFSATRSESNSPRNNEMLLYAGAVGENGRDFGYNGYIVLAAKNVYAPGTAKLISSDARSKRNIALAPYGIKDFRKFNIYNFTLKYDKDHLKHIGVMAQEYRKAFPLAIVKGGKYLSIQPDWLYYSMINAVKDLDKLVQEFQVKLDEYVNNFESIKSRISTLEQSVAKEKQNNANMRKELEQINAQLLAKTKNNNKL